MGKRGSFSSRFGVIAAVGGSVVGLGNIWRFPYIVGENGGAAFLFIYILISFAIAIPIMLSEFSIGRLTKRNSKRSFQKLAPGTQWYWVGYMGLITAFVILSFYCVIAGWSLEFLKESILNEFAGKSSAEISASFNGFVASGWRPVVWTVVFVVCSLYIVISGIEKGIERYNKILMPMLGVLMVGLVINSLTLDGAREGVRFLLNPDFSKINGHVVLQALGQSFFSLSLGMGCMITYGSYIKKNENMMKVAAMVSISDVSIALLSGLAIFPAVFSFGISPTSGPELVFLTLPNVFQQMIGGYYVSIIFFFLLFLAAITSSISLIEVITAYVSEEMRMPRKKAVFITAAAIAITSVVTALSQMPSSPIRIMGYNLFDFFDNASSNVLMPLGGVLIVIFTGWVLLPSKFKQELTNNGTVGLKIYPIIRFLIKFVAPIVITILFMNKIGIIK